MESNTLFNKKLSAYQVAIGYYPLPGEPTPPSTPSLPIQFKLSTNRSLNPTEVAKDVLTKFAEVRVCLYIPGTAFDALGTRHGRGGGWYDRLLHAVPPQWMRIGLCFESNFSPDFLKREVWDQPVDWVVVRKADGVEYYETNARAEV